MSNFKKYIITLLSCLFIIDYAIGQDKASIIKAIDLYVSNAELNSKAIKVVNVDSSENEDQHQDTYFIDPTSKKLTKVEFVIIKPEVKMTYYFQDTSFIKVMAIDKSTSQTFVIHAYFNKGKILHLTHRSIDGDNSGKALIRKASIYLAKFENFKE